MRYDLAKAKHLEAQRKMSIYNLQNIFIITIYECHNVEKGSPVVMNLQRIIYFYLTMALFEKFRVYQSSYNSS